MIDQTAYLEIAIMATVPKLRTSSGYLTAYAFRCGYVEPWFDYDGGDKLTIEWEHCCFHVKGVVNGAHVWESAIKLSEARKIVSRLRRGR